MNRYGYLSKLFYILILSISIAITCQTTVTDVNLLGKSLNITARLTNVLQYHGINTINFKVNSSDVKAIYCLEIDLPINLQCTSLTEEIGSLYHQCDITFNGTPLITTLLLSKKTLTCYAITEIIADVTLFGFLYKHNLFPEEDELIDHINLETKPIPDSLTRIIESDPYTIVTSTLILSLCVLISVFLPCIIVLFTRSRATIF